MNSDVITQERIDELLDFLPNFEDPERKYIVGWEPPWYAVYADDVDAFFYLAGQPCWQDHNYEIDVAGKMVRDDDVVATADLEQIKTMMTFCVRGERFASGHWGVMLRKGRISALLKRLQVLRQTVPEA